MLVVLQNLLLYNRDKYLFQKMDEGGSMENSQVSKRGYLNDNFRIFFLKDTKSQPIAYHYHEFYKVILFLSGDVTYMVEGRSYQLAPWDILIIGHHQIHRSIVRGQEEYERIILWINRDFLEQEILPNTKLHHCFELGVTQKNYLIRAGKQERIGYLSLLKELKTSMESKEFGSDLYSMTLFWQAMISLNRIALRTKSITTAARVQSNQTVDLLIDYIHKNLSKDLSIETLSKELYLSASYLMHQFKETTGTSLHAYITKKRLSYAIELIRNGVPATNASSQSGYLDYSTFLRNFRKAYHCTPTEYLLSTQKYYPFPEHEIRE